jgi:uncharacterized protein
MIAQEAQMQFDECVRLRIYVGEDKLHGDRPLYQVIVRKAHDLQFAGTTVLRGTQGFGRSTRLHTADVLFSDDLPVIIEIVDSYDRVDRLLELLEDIDGIGLITRERAEAARFGGRLAAPPQGARAVSPETSKGDQ